MVKHLVDSNLVKHPVHANGGAFAHKACLTKSLIEAPWKVALRAGLNVESELQDFFSPREALKFEDVVRFHGHDVAQSIVGSLSCGGVAMLKNPTFKMTRCRSTWELDRCTGFLISGCAALQL